jgi:hypothetical protein
MMSGMSIMASRLTLLLMLSSKQTGILRLSFDHPCLPTALTELQRILKGNLHLQIQALADDEPQNGEE